MIQPIYTSVSNATIKPCSKGCIVSSEPIPLLRNNYLGEYRTELEKAKVRKNLGIADEASLLWGNISGTIESLKDLVEYVEQKWAYESDLVENIETVKEALDYALYFISLYESNTEDIAEIRVEIELIRASITQVLSSLQDNIDKNSEDIKSLSDDIESINLQISDINDSIANIDVDNNIRNWIINSLLGSNTIELKEDGVLEVIISDREDNSIKLLTLEIITDEGTSSVTLPGIYVKDLEPELEGVNLELQNVKVSLEETNEKVNANSDSISAILLDIENIDIYLTELPDGTISSVLLGTTVESLKGKPFSLIIDTLLFPTVVRDLVYPQLYYSIPTLLVEVGSPLLSVSAVFILNDAGEELDRSETLMHNSLVVESPTYDFIGNYEYSCVVDYAAGEYLIDNKGLITDKRIEAGSISTSSLVTATYPWYSGNITGLTKLNLVPFGSPSGIITFAMSGKAIIKLPGANTLLNSFTVDGGLGYLNVDLSGWDTSTELINGYIYKVWTKTDSYSAVLPHQINFTLLE